MAQRLNRDDSMRRKTPPGDKEGSAQAGKEGPVRKGSVSSGGSRLFRKAPAERWAQRRGSSQVWGGPHPENSGESRAGVRHQIRVLGGSLWLNIQRTEGSEKPGSRGSSRQLL